MKFGRIKVSLSLLVAIMSARAGEPPLTLSWPVETVLLAGGLAGEGIGQYRVSAMTPPGPADLRRGDLAPWDRFAAGWYNANLATVSTILTVGVTGAMFYADAWDKARGHAAWTPVLQDGLILSEALAWSGALNLNARAFQLHPRPLAYDSTNPASERTSRDAGGAFYSGHASAAFLGAAFLATVYPLRHPEFQHPGLLWAGSMAAASSVAILRVASGKHFPSDVVAGAAVGTLLGWGFAKIHEVHDANRKGRTLSACAEPGRSVVEGRFLSVVEGWSFNVWPQSGGLAVQAARPLAAW